MGPKTRDQKFPLSEALYAGLLMLVCVVLFFSLLNMRTLWETDEARYAEIAREMVEAPSWEWWVVPRLNHVKYMEKPPLSYWTTAIFFKIFGISDYTARLTPAVYGTLSLMLAFLLGRAMWTGRAGFFTGICLASSVMFVLLSRILLVDMLLCFGIVLAIYGLWGITQGNRWGTYAFWTGCAIGFLTKGLLGPGLAGMASVLYLVISGQYRMLVRLFDWRGMALFAVLVLPWLIAATVLEDGFIKYFFWDEQFGRLATNAHQRHEPFYYYFGIVPAAFTPWIVLLPWAIWKTWPGAAWRSSENRPWLLSVVWFGSYFVFLTLSQSKMLHYALPMMPPLALIMGRALAGLGESGWRSESGGFLAISIDVLAVLLLIAGAAMFMAPQFIQDVSYDHFGLLIFIGPLVLGLAALACHLFRRRAWVAIAAPLTVFAMLAGIWVTAAATLDPYRSVQKLVASIAGEIKPDDILATYGDYYHGAVFYGKRRVMVIGNWGELEYGRARDTDADKWFINERPDPDNLLKVMYRPERIFVITETDKYRRVINSPQRKKNGPPLYEWARAGDKTLFCNRPHR